MMNNIHVTGGAHVEDRVQEVAAEMHAWELVEALKAAVAGAPHWRAEAQALLRDISNGVLPDHRPL